jgi:hypothetical protein
MMNARMNVVVRRTAKRAEPFGSAFILCATFCLNAKGGNERNNMTV